MADSDIKTGGTKLIGADIFVLLSLLYPFLAMNFHYAKIK